MTCRLHCVKVVVESIIMCLKWLWSGVPRIECPRKDDSNTMTKDYILLIKFTYIKLYYREH